MTVVIKGKDRDIKLAESVRQAFIAEYNNAGKFEELLRSLGSNTVDKLVHRLNRTEKIDLYKDYSDLKAIAQEVLDTGNRKVFLEACSVDDARTWINNKGKYQEIAFESLYKVFRSEEKLRAFVGA